MKIINKKLAWVIYPALEQEFKWSRNGKKKTTHPYPPTTIPI